jgi:hypothetical protein
VCVIYADTEAVKRVSKVWVPNINPFSDKVMWWQDAEIISYIKDLPFDYNPAKTLLMSWVQDKKPDQVQLLIPVELVKPTGAMGISAVCKETIAELPDNGAINYDVIFQDNILGERGPNTPST